MMEMKLYSYIQCGGQYYLSYDRIEIFPEAFVIPVIFISFHSIINVSFVVGIPILEIKHCVHRTHSVTDSFPEVSLWESDVQEHALKPISVGDFF